MTQNETEIPERKKLIIVHSIKGGCGKTTTALALSQYFGKNKSQKVCYIDADLVGPGTQALAAIEEPDKKFSFTNYVLLNPFENPEFFKSPFEDNDWEKFRKFLCAPSESSGKKEGGRLFNAIFSSTDHEIVEKAIRATSDVFFAEDIKAKLKVLLGKLYSNDFGTIIFDTTPGMQGITKVILEIADDVRDPSREESSKININEAAYHTIIKDVDVLNILISTNNYSHLQSLLTYLYDNKNNLSETNNFKHLILLNQLPIGYELESPPKNKTPLAEVQELDSSKDSKDLYRMVEHKNFLFSLLDDYHIDSIKFPEIKNIGEKTIAIPEMVDFRRKTAHFGGSSKFNVDEYFSLLSKQVSGGFFEEMGKRIEDLMKK